VVNRATVDFGRHQYAAVTGINLYPADLNWLEDWSPARRGVSKSTAAWQQRVPWTGQQQNDTRKINGEITGA